MPAAAVVGNDDTVMIISSVDEAQGELAIVQRKVALAPTVKPVKPDVAEDGVVIVATPLTKLHVPVPVVGALPARVAVVVLHMVWSLPAAAVVGNDDTLITTSSVEAAQAPLLIVHLKVALDPTTNAVTPLVADDGVVTVAVPVITLHAPVPVVAVFPAKVVVVTLQRL